MQNIRAVICFPFCHQCQNIYLSNQIMFQQTNLTQFSKNQSNIITFKTYTHLHKPLTSQMQIQYSLFHLKQMDKIFWNVNINKNISIHIKQLYKIISYAINFQKLLFSFLFYFFLLGVIFGLCLFQMIGFQIFYLITMNIGLESPQSLRYFQTFMQEDEILYKNQRSNIRVYRKHDSLYVVKQSKMNHTSRQKKSQGEICKRIIKNRPRHIVQIFNVWENNGYQFIVTKYYPYTLKQYLKNKRQVIDESLGIKIFLQILYGLIDLGCMHRDLKLQNILVEEKDNQPHVVLIDFNTCNQGQFLNQSRVGTLAYMAPQVLFMQNDKIPYTRKVDIWSLGIILYKIFLGEDKYPFNFNFNMNQSIQAFHRRIQQNRGSLQKQLPQVVRYLLRQMLIQQPYKRISLIQILTKLKQKQLEQILNPKILTVDTYEQHKLKYYYGKQIEVDKEQKKTLQMLEKIRNGYNKFYLYFQNEKQLWQGTNHYNKLIVFVYFGLSKILETYQHLRKYSKIKENVLIKYIFTDESNVKTIKIQQHELNRRIQRYFKPQQIEKLKHQNFLQNQTIRSIMNQLLSKHIYSSLFQEYKKLMQ